MREQAISNALAKLKLKVTQIEPGGSPDYFNERTGRCQKCSARFIWPAKLGRTKDMKCPFCGDQLQQTTYMWKGHTFRIEKK